MLNFFRNMGTTELLIVLGIIVLLFGGKKIKELARGLGESKAEVKKVKEEVTKAVKGEPLEDE